MRTISILSLLLILTIAGLAEARDVWNGPPDGTWRRGDPGSTYEHWDFNTPDNPSVPEDFNNPYGVPTADVRRRVGVRDVGLPAGDVRAGHGDRLALRPTRPAARSSCRFPTSPNRTS